MNLIICSCFECHVKFLRIDYDDTPRRIRCPSCLNKRRTETQEKNKKSRDQDPDLSFPVRVCKNCVHYQPIKNKIVRGIWGRCAMGYAGDKDDSYAQEVGDAGYVAFNQWCNHFEIKSEGVDEGGCQEERLILFGGVKELSR